MLPSLTLDFGTEAGACMENARPLGQTPQKQLTCVFVASIKEKLQEKQTEKMGRQDREGEEAVQENTFRQ